MIQLRRVVTILILLLGTNSVFAEINLSSSLHCTYQVGQFLSKNKAENVKNRKPMSWTFNGLTTDKAIYVSGGSSGNVLVTPIENGTAIYLPFKIGAHTFTVWKTGESIWNKQSNLIGAVNSQHYFGSCEN